MSLSYHFPLLLGSLSTILLISGLLHPRTCYISVDCLKINFARNSTIRRVCIVVNVKTFMTKNQNSEGFYFLDTHNSSIPALSNAFIMFYTCSNRCVDCFCNENLDSHTCTRTIPHKIIQILCQFSCGS